ncbi:MAG: RsmD family RNA methyltransferase, partial [Lachnospiraceae bacterium]|nr:RsmD family RNA methyltransferase [Lachnospiraceae bacterium]
MRIIGGYLKGKNILPPANYAARPTTDFAKEGLFNILINEYDIEELTVLDLFSGTGSISFEFASRGCKDIISIEMNPAHTKFIKQVASTYKVKGMQVIRHNVFDFLEICTKKFDIIFADPPYAIEGLDTIPDKIFEKQLLNPQGYLILEHPGTYNFEDHKY